MMLTSGKRLFLLLVPPLILAIPFACLIIILDRIAGSLVSSNFSRNRFSGGTTLYIPGSGSSSSGVLIRTNTSPTLAIVGASAVAALIGILSCTGIYELRKVNGTSRRYQRVWAWSMIIWNVIGAGLCLGVLVWASVLQGGEKGWSGLDDLNADVGTGRGIQGRRLTRETWTCSLHGIFGDQVDWAGSVCGLAKAERFLLIPLMLSLFLTLFSIYTLSRTRGGLKWLFGGAERYGAFDSVYEMNARNDPRAGPTPAPQPFYYANPPPAYPPQGPGAWNGQQQGGWMGGPPPPVMYGQPGYGPQYGPPPPQQMPGSAQPPLGQQQQQQQQGTVPAVMQAKNPATAGERSVFQ